jgi:hypothetical protein
MDNTIAVALVIALLGIAWAINLCAEQLRRIALALEARDEGESPHG